MAEITARQKQLCPACGAAAEWNPAKQALVCPYCSTVLPPPLPGEGASASENDLAAALNALGREKRGWQAEKTSVKCQSCQAISVFDPSRVGQRCEFCGSAALIPYEEIKAPIRPESLLEFKIPEPAVRDLVRKWYGNRWFAPNALNARSLTDTVRGVYIPYWTFDAQVAADWTADAGYYYYVTENYVDSDGKSRSRQVQKTRWVPSSGSIEHFFDDELVPASHGIDETLLRKIEPFPTRSDLKPYDPHFLSGWVVEQYQIDLVAAAQNSRRIMEQKTRQLCSAEVPGDTQRNLEVAATFSAQTFKHVLVPVWLVAYTYGARTYQVVVNGYTGSIAGRHPLSWIKIALAVFVVLMVVIIGLALYAN